MIIVCSATCPSHFPLVWSTIDFPLSGLDEPGSILIFDGAQEEPQHMGRQW
jgi:hypothetical protein